MQAFLSLINKIAQKVHILCVTGAAINKEIVPWVT